MVLNVSRLLLLAPALTFWLGAAFVLSAYHLGSSPDDPAAWQAFLTLAPIARGPVNLVVGLPGMGYAAAFLVFALAALLGCVLALFPARAVRAAFIYAHLAFLMLFYSLCRAAVFTAGGHAGTTAPGSPIDWSVDLSGFPTAGVALLVLVVLSCAFTHLPMLRRLKAQIDMGRAANASPPGRLR